MKYYLPLCVMSAAAVSLAAETHTTIPAQFLGAWASSAAKCSSPDTDDLRMRITPDSMSFWESDGRVLSVATEGELELAVLVELSGEGERWLEALQFRLSPDRKTLTNVTGRRTVAVRVRCPNANSR
jgi:hypothetical protein